MKSWQTHENINIYDYEDPAHFKRWAVYNKHFNNNVKDYTHSLVIAEREAEREREELERLEAEGRRLAQRQELAATKRAEFLAFAGAVGMHPLHYADWLVSYLRFGGTAKRSPLDFPYELHDSGFDADSVWMLTNPDIDAGMMPAGFGKNSMQVFLPEQSRFLRQLRLAVRECHGTVEPRDAAREHHTGPFYQSGIEKVYGRSVLYYYDEISIDRTFSPDLTLRVGRTNRPDAVQLYRDVVPLAYDIAAGDDGVLEQLDRIITNGTNQLKQQR